MILQPVAAERLPGGAAGASARAGRTPLRTAETVILFLICLVYSGTFWPLDELFHVGRLTLEGFSPLSRAEAIATALFVAVAGATQPRATLATLGLGWPILALVGFTFLSAFWSDAPGLVLRRSAVMTITTLFAFSLSQARPFPRLVSVLVQVFALLALATVATMVIAPVPGIDQTVADRHAWRGIFTTKNELGWVTALASIVAAVALRQGYGSRLLAAATLLVDLILLALTSSKTALMLLAAALGAAILGGLVRQRTGFGLFAAFLGLCGVLLAVGIALSSPDALLAAIDRGAGLTGRVDLWQHVVRAIGGRPWLGYGFGAFWRSDSVEAQQIWNAVGWQPPHAHNGWLELGLNLGLAGVIGTALLWLAALGRVARLLVAPGARHIVFCLILLTVIFVENLTETGLFRASDLSWVLFVYVFLHLKREAGVRTLAVGRPLGSALRSAA